MARHSTPENTSRSSYPVAMRGLIAAIVVLGVLTGQAWASKPAHVRPGANYLAAQALKQYEYAHHPNLKGGGPGSEIECRGTHPHRSRCHYTITDPALPSPCVVEAIAIVPGGNAPVRFPWLIESATCSD